MSGPTSRRLDPAGAAAVLWCGVPVHARSSDGAPAGSGTSPPPSPATTKDVEARLRAVLVGGRLLFDGSLAARALAAIGGYGASALVPLDASRLDLAAIFDAYVAAADVPTEPGLAGAVLEALGGGAPLTAACGGDELFGTGPDARLAARATRPRALRRRFRPPADALDVAAALRAEIEGLDAAPLHRASSLAAVLPTVTRDALATFGPRAVPGGLGHEHRPCVLFARLRRLGLDELAREAVGVSLPFARPDVRAVVEALPEGVRFGRAGSGGALARWAATGPVGSSLAPAGPAGVHGIVETACAGVLRSRIEALLDRASRLPWFRGEAVNEVARRLRAGTHGWTGRRALVVALLAHTLARDGLAPA